MASCLEVLLLLSAALVALTATEAFSYRSCRSIKNRLLDLAENYPGIITMEAEKEDGRCSVKAADDDCKTRVVTLADHASLGDDVARPQILRDDSVHESGALGPPSFSLVRGERCRRGCGGGCVLDEDGRCPRCCCAVDARRGDVRRRAGGDMGKRRIGRDLLGLIERREECERPKRVGKSARI